jgi:hypothetical protein
LSNAELTERPQIQAHERKYITTVMPLVQNYNEYPNSLCKELFINNLYGEEEMMNFRKKEDEDIDYNDVCMFKFDEYFTV